MNDFDKQIITEMRIFLGDANARLDWQAQGAKGYAHSILGNYITEAIHSLNNLTYDGDDLYYDFDKVIRKIIKEKE